MSGDKVRDSLQDELIPMLEILAGLKSQAEAASSSSDVKKMKSTLLGLLRACFGEDVSQANICARFGDQVDAMDRYIKEMGPVPQPGVGLVVKYNSVYAVRILAAFVYKLSDNLEQKWLDFWSETPADFVRLLGVHDIFLKYYLYLYIIPQLIAIRSCNGSGLVDWDHGCSLNHIATDPAAGRATISFDLLQPKEDLLKSFEKFVDQAKEKIKLSPEPENKMFLNLYDFPRKKDGHRSKPLYADWYKAIISFEQATDSKSCYQAEADWDLSKSGVTAKTFLNRTNRYYSLLHSVMSNTFPLSE